MKRCRSVYGEPRSGNKGHVGGEASRCGMYGTVATFPKGRGTMYCQVTRERVL